MHPPQAEENKEEAAAAAWGTGADSEAHQTGPASCFSHAKNWGLPLTSALAWVESSSSSRTGWSAGKSWISSMILTPRPVITALCRRPSSTRHKRCPVMAPLSSLPPFLRGGLFHFWQARSTI